MSFVEFFLFVYGCVHLVMQRAGMILAQLYHLGVMVKLP
jgi:hypothetical protein